MKGIVFTLLNEMVEENYGLEAWDQLLQNASCDGIYISTETYPDAELMALVGAASEMTNIPANALVKAFGEYMFPSFQEKYPILFKEGMTFKPFLLTVDRVIHVEVRKLYPDAGLPEFKYQDESDNELVMLYRSPRKLCALAEGLIAGAAKHFNADYQLKHDICMHNGDDHCRFELTGIA
jgi:predicted hydrocarbon binding protein